MKILLVTDAWEPQVNGVVRTYQNTIKELRAMGHEVNVIHPYLSYLRRKPLTGYKEIEYVTNPWAIRHMVAYEMSMETHIHIATEGPLGLVARWVCRNGKFTTSYHTQFPEFIQKRTRIPASFFYPYFRWFHKKSAAVLTPTEYMQEYLTDKRFRRVKVWTRGVDTNVFRHELRNDPGYYLLCVSRVSQEKGLDDFCQLDHPRKLLVGDGPYLKTLQKRYPDVKFTGKLEGKELATYYANADCFVFPSLTDTFGIVMLESIACGTPIASYPTAGALEVVEPNINGCLVQGEVKTLQEAVRRCMDINRWDVVESSHKWTWKRATESFIENISS